MVGAYQETPGYRFKHSCRGELILDRDYEESSAFVVANDAPLIGECAATRGRIATEFSRILAPQGPRAPDVRLASALGRLPRRQRPAAHRRTRPNAKGVVQQKAAMSTPA